MLYRLGRESDNEEVLLEMIKELQKFAQKRGREANIAKRRMTGLGNVVKQNAEMSAQIQKEQTEVRARLIAEKDAEILKKNEVIKSNEDAINEDAYKINREIDRLRELNTKESKRMENFLTGKR